MFTKEEVAARHAAKAEEIAKAKRAQNYAAEDAIAALPRLEDGTPYFIVPLSDPAASKVAHFFAQQKRAQGDEREQIRLLNIAHGAQKKGI